MLTIKQLLVAARRDLATALPDNEARIEAQALLCRSLGDVTRAWLITHENDPPALEQSRTFEELLRRRLAGEPVAYLLGEREFYGLNFLVTPDVLIPRPDTEALVEAALAHIPRHGPCRILDMGTGSGAIAITIAVHRPEASVTGIDRSPPALAVAKENARRLHAGNAEFRVSHWFETLTGERFEVIVSNPPYIAAIDPHLAQGDLRFEPPAALASGPDGLDDIRHIVGAAPGHLVAGGWLLLEHGYDQASAVAELLRTAGFSAVSSLPDLAGTLRVTQGKRP